MNRPINHDYYGVAVPAPARNGNFDGEAYAAAFIGMLELHKRMETLLARMAAKLDDLAADPADPFNDDQDCDAEESDFGGSGTGNGCDEDDEAGGDDEPSLGSSAPGENSSQAAWSIGSTDDTEDEHDGSEPDVDDEPSLGATEAVNQRHAWTTPQGWAGGYPDIEEEVSAGVNPMPRPRLHHSPSDMAAAVERQLRAMPRAR